MNNREIDAFIRNALAEDIGSGDHTSLACIPEKSVKKARLLCKEAGVLAGVELADRTFHFLDPEIEFRRFFNDGSRIKAGDIAFEVEGHARQILMAERLILNCMQRMSGIATNTARMVEKIKSYPTKILDTRKTTPGFRAVEKWAVRIGGGLNHRFGLFDMIMIKDNHIDCSGGIAKSIQAVHKYLEKKGLDLKIEVEARDLDEVDQILARGGIHRIMLDNFNISDLKKAVEKINRQYETEASGGINEENIADYAACGVDFISVGALTHHIKSLDMSLKAI